MWLERYIIIVVSLLGDFLPSSWGMYTGTLWDWATFVGTHRTLPHPVLPLHPLPADDLDLRDAHHAARSEARGGVGRVRRRPPLHGLMAEFSDLEELVHATRTAHEAGYRQMDAYTPFPIEELGERSPATTAACPSWCCWAASSAASRGFALCYWTSVIDYPINVGGRPLNSWPSFIPITFECTVLGAALVDRLRHARAERPPDAVPSGLQRAALRALVARSVLPLHRGRRSAVRPRGDAALPRAPRCPRQVSEVEH